MSHWPFIAFHRHGQQLLIFILRMERFFRLLGNENVVVAGAVLASTGYFAWQWWAEQRQQRLERQQREELERRMHVDFKTTWRRDELKAYDGRDPRKPILLAVKGRVYNVWRGREFYGPGQAYSIFAGTDATRLLAKELLEPESPEEAAKPLSGAQAEQLQAWIDQFDWKYTDVGTLAEPRSEQWREE